jgi:hypothetical protein
MVTALAIGTNNVGEASSKLRCRFFVGHGIITALRAIQNTVGMKTSGWISTAFSFDPCKNIRRIHSGTRKHDGPKSVTRVCLSEPQ